VKEGTTPQHIAIIMDGNGRWAKQRFQPRIFGHRAGAKTVRKIVEYCMSHNITALTLFAFSTENWSRPKEEVSLLMELFAKILAKEVDDLDKNNVRLRVIGAVSKFSNTLQQAIADAEHLTESNTGLILNIAANYGGRWDIVNAAKLCATAVAEEKIKPEDITEAWFAQHLQLSDLPEPDLFIRTGGEVRISNFLTWQLAYTELHFTDTLWPAFSDHDMDEAIAQFSQRERRFGKTSEQLK